MKIGSVSLSSPFVIAPMAGMTDTAFRRLEASGRMWSVVTEMVSSEGLVRGIDRTLEYTEFTKKSGRCPFRSSTRSRKMARRGTNRRRSWRRHRRREHGLSGSQDLRAQCRLQPDARTEHAASVAAMTRKVRIPVTVKMRAGWNDDSVNAPELARRVEDAGAAAVAVHGRTAEQSYRGESDWSLIDRVADSLRIPVLGSGDCVEPSQILERMRAGSVSGVLVGRGVLRNPWILAQAHDLQRAARRATSLMSIAAASCSTTWRCCSMRARTKRKASVMAPW